MSQVSWKNTANLVKKSNSGNDINFKEVFLTITPDKAPGSESVNTIRFLEIPTAYLVHWPNKKGEAGKLERCDFPDKEETKKPTRICHAMISDSGATKEDKDCPWCQMGFSRQARYMVNVISRENEKVMILDCPANIINEVAEWREGAIAEDLENTDPSSWDSPAPDFRVKATRLNGGSIEWRITATTKMKPIGDAEQEMVRAINPNAETDEAALKLYSVDMFTKPSLLGGGTQERQTKQAATADTAPAPAPKPSPAPSAMNPYTDSDEDDDEDEVAPISVKSNPKPIAVEEDDDDWDDV